MTNQSSEEQPQPRRRRRWLWLAGLAILLGALWQLITDPYREEEKELRTQIRDTVKERFPEEAAAFSESFGLVRFNVDGATCTGGAPGPSSVVLVHGLDDPGKVWRSLAPELCRQSFDVWLMQYPNDQPIGESADLLFGELKELRELGVDRISVVAHSMGGLVSREMLTHPETGYAESARHGVVPEVTALVMVGTPNHGSPLARIRVLAEVRDQIARLAKGEGSWLGGILDGAGEAKIDLLPESRFLTELNRRPHPEGVDMLVIAGVAGPWSESQIDRWIADLRREAPEDQQSGLSDLGASLVSLTRGLGDGLVSVESSRLEGVDHQTVDGTHLTMIRNITEGNERIPPAVPIILDRLARADE